MKRLILAAALAIAPVALAHDGHTHADRPSRAQTEAVVLGQGAHQYKTIPGWAKVLKGDHFGPTHGSAAVDKEGNIYITLNSANQDGFGILVYDKEGKVKKGIAKGEHGLHSLIYVEQDGKGFLYGAQNGQKDKKGAVKLSTAKSCCGWASPSSLLLVASTRPVLRLGPTVTSTWPTATPRNLFTSSTRTASMSVTSVAAARVMASSTPAMASTLTIVARSRRC